MYGKKVKLRLVFLALILASVILTVFLVLQSLKENVVYFQSPSEIKSLIELNKQKIRVGGMVKEQSVFITLYFVTKLQLLKEQKKFASKFGSLNIENANAARLQNINKEILLNLSKI